MRDPQKILKFKHSKWKTYKIKVIKSLKRRFFFNGSLISPKLKQWDRKRLFFKDSLTIKRSLYQLSDTSLKLDNFKTAFKGKSLSKLDQVPFLNNVLLKSEFNLAILLFKLNFFSNIYEARKHIECGLVLVNENYVSHNYFLKKGDLISFNNLILNFKQIQNNQIRMAIYIPFIEVDFYTNKIVIIKNLNDLSLEDISLFMCKHTDLSKLRQALYRS